MQYGIRLREDKGNEDLSWDEFTSLLAGIMPDTPLGRIVTIRSENDAKVLKDFTKEQRQIRSEWIKFKTQQNSDNGNKNEQLLIMQNELKKMFS